MQFMDGQEIEWLDEDEVECIDQKILSLSAYNRTHVIALSSRMPP